MVHVSVTGLRLKAAHHMPRFYWHAIRSFRQAQSADGVLLAETRTINGIHHTLTVWQDRDYMRAYLAAGAHKEAMKIFRRIATGSVWGYESDGIPDWESALDQWRRHGRTV